MSKITLTGFALSHFCFSETAQEIMQPPPPQLRRPGPIRTNHSRTPHARRSLDGGGTGTFQKMIVENGSVTMDLDLNRLNGISSIGARPTTLHFATAANSFFPFWFSTICCAAPSRAQWHSFARAQPFPSFLLR